MRSVSVSHLRWTNLHADMGIPDPKPQFSYLVTKLRKYDLAYLHVTEPRVGGNIDVDSPPQSNDFLREIWCKEGRNGVFISAGGHTRQKDTGDSRSISLRPLIHTGSGRRTLHCLLDMASSPAAFPYLGLVSSRSVAATTPVILKVLTCSPDHGAQQSSY